MSSSNNLTHLRRSVLENNQAAIAQLQEAITQRLQALEHVHLEPVNREIRHLHKQSAQLEATIAHLATRLHQLTDTQKIQQLQENLVHFGGEVSRLEAQLQTLMQTPGQGNFSSLQQQIQQLHRSTQQFAPGTALQPPGSNLPLHQEATRSATHENHLSQSHPIVESGMSSPHLPLEQIPPGIEDGATPAIASLRDSLTHLERRLDQLSQEDLVNLRQEFQAVTESRMDNLQQQLDQVHQVTQSLEKQQQVLKDCVNHLPQLLDFTALQSQFKFLTQRIEGTEQSITQMQNRLETSLKSQLQEMTQHLQAVQTTRDHGLVLDFKRSSGSQGTGIYGSRSVLEEALEQARERLIIVWSRPDRGMLDPRLIEQFHAFLDRQGVLEIGWGHLSDAYEVCSPRFLNANWAGNLGEKRLLRETLNQLADLKRVYPNQFRFKVMGTDENFLVCDRHFAVLGIQPIATSSSSFPEVVVGLRTQEAQVIHQLIDRFDHPTLDSRDVFAYLSRAATRYEFGDHSGAIADYAHAMEIDPDDDVAPNNRGIVYFDLGDYQNALADFEQSLRLNPSSAAAYYNRGVVRAETGDKLGAIEDYCYATQADPDCAIAYFYRGLERTRLGNKLGAVHDYNEVLRIEPQNAKVYFYRGLAHIKLGENRSAIADLNLAADLFARRGDQASHQQTLDAIAQFQKALETNPDRPLITSQGR